MASRCWINLGADGTFALSGKLSSTAADVDYLLDGALSSASRLVLFFHGGLVNEASGLASAERMAGNYGTTAASIGRDQPMADFKARWAASSPQENFPNL